MRYYRYAVGALLCVAFATRPAVAQDPFVYFAGNPANAWFTVGGTCDAPTLTANYLFFISGDVTSANLPARWTALPFQICAPMTFDSIVYMPGLTAGAPNLYIWITGSRTGADGRPEPDLGNILFFGDFGAYPGDPPVPGQGDVQIPTYYGGSTNFTYLRTTPLNQSITLSPGLYYAIIVGDEDFGAAGPFDSYIALAMGAPGGPRLYYTPRGLGSNPVGGVIQPASWQRFRYNPATFPCERILNPLLDGRANDPFGGQHGPALYQGVLGFRNSAATPGKVTGTASFGDLNGTAPAATVEVIFYLPGTKAACRTVQHAGALYARHFHYRHPKCCRGHLRCGGTSYLLEYHFVYQLPNRPLCDRVHDSSRPSLAGRAHPECECQRHGGSG
jgi:hypothetical protein